MSDYEIWPWTRVTQLAFRAEDTGQRFEDRGTKVHFEDLEASWCSSRTNGRGKEWCEMKLGQEFSTYKLWLSA